MHAAANGLTVYGIFDGHGMKGHTVSDIVKQQLPKALVRAAAAGEHEDRYVKESYKSIQHASEHPSSLDS